MRWKIFKKCKPQNIRIESDLTGESGFMEGREKTVVDCVEDAKTAKFALYFIYGLVSEKRKIGDMFPFPLDEFHDADMSTMFNLIVNNLIKKEENKGNKG